VLAQADHRRLLSDENFTLDGTMIEAWANRRSFQEKKARNPF
jgi:transposase